MITGLEALGADEPGRKVARLRDMQSAMSPGKEQVGLDAEVGDASPFARVAASAQEPAASGSVTLAASEGLLDKKFTPMNETINQIQSQVGGLKLEVKRDMDQVKSDMSTLKDTVKLQGIRLKEVESKINLEAAEPLPTDPEILKKISHIEQTLADLGPYRNHLGPPIVKSNCVAVVGGLAGAVSLEEAEKWLRNELSVLKLASPLKLFVKGSEFKDVVFVRFSNPESMEAMVDTIKAKSLKLSGNAIWSNPDRPAHVRAPLRFLFGLKKLLVSWDFNKKAIYVDEASSTLEICNVPILEAISQEGSLKLNWLSPKWEHWGDFQTNANFQDLKEKCNATLKEAHEQRSKGAGKGSVTA